MIQRITIMIITTRKKKHHKQNLVSGLKKSIVQSGKNLKACEISTTEDTGTGVGPN